MITAVDTSVLLDVFSADPRFVGPSQTALRRAMAESTLVACDVVFAELRPWFPSREALLKATSILGLELTATSLDAALVAGEAWERYRKAGGPRQHLI